MASEPENNSGFQRKETSKSFLGPMAGGSAANAAILPYLFLDQMPIPQVGPSVSAPTSDVHMASLATSQASEVTIECFLSFSI